jgi:sugar/nucleoside kinase (ribokinase family)
MSSMLVVGSVAFDTLHFATESHPKVLGGSAVYAAIAGAHFAPVQLVGVVGRDFPDSALHLLRSRNVDLGGLEVVDGETFHWEGRYSDDLSSRQTIRTDLNVFADFRPKIPEAYRDTPYVMLGNIDPTLQLEVLEQIRAPKLVLADTMNLWIDIKNDALRELVRKVDLLILNDEEAMQLTGHKNLVKAARNLQDMGPDTVIIKKGEHGALLFEGAEVFAVPALPLETVADPTGAGDTFAGALLGYVAKQDSIDGATLRRAVVYGSTVASFCVEGVSTHRLVTADSAAVQTRFEQFRKLTGF